MARLATERAVAWAAVALGGAWLALFARDMRALRRIPKLKASAAPDPAPAVEVIIPARNEERTIAASAGGMAQQAYPGLVVTVIDDGSTDGTAAELARLAKAYPSLRRREGAPLPEGWKGKCWACWQAAEPSGAEWLLFLDADTRPQPGLVAAGVTYCQRSGIDLLTLMPHQELGSFWERAILPAFFAMIQATFPIEEVNRPGSEIVLANGQFILVRREAYLRAGGHRAVYDQVLEDVELAQAVARHGGRIAVLDGRELLEVRMYTSGAEVWEGLTKNAIAGMRNGGSRATWAGVRQSLVALGPLGLGLLALWAQVRRWPQRERALVLMSALSVGGGAAWGWPRFMRELYRLPGWTGALFPLGHSAYMAIAAGAAWRIRRGAGIVWKGRVYRE